MWEIGRKKILTSYCTVLDFIHECLFCLQCNNGFIYYTCVTHHDKKKKRIICSFSWQIGKTKNISLEMSSFLYNFYFLNRSNKKIYIKKRFQNKYFRQNYFQKKVVPAITDICTGGQQCKYQLLGSGEITKN